MQTQIECGVISQVLGDEMTATHRFLPTPGPTQLKSTTCDIETHLAGRVRITFECSSYSHGRHTFWHWRGKGAAQVEQRYR